MGKKNLDAIYSFFDLEKPLLKTLAGQKKLREDEIEEITGQVELSVVAHLSLAERVGKYEVRYTQKMTLNKLRRLY